MVRLLPPQEQTLSLSRKKCYLADQSSSKNANDSNPPSKLSTIEKETGNKPKPYSEARSHDKDEQICGKENRVTIKTSRSWFHQLKKII